MVDLDIGVLERVGKLVDDARKPGAVGLVVITAEEAASLLASAVDAAKVGEARALAACAKLLDVLCGDPRFEGAAAEALDEAAGMIRARGFTNPPEALSASEASPPGSTSPLPPCGSYDPRR